MRKGRHCDPTASGGRFGASGISATASHVRGDRDAPRPQGRRQDPVAIDEPAREGAVVYAAAPARGAAGLVVSAVVGPKGPM